MTKAAFKDYVVSELGFVKEENGQGAFLMGKINGINLTIRDHLLDRIQEKEGPDGLYNLYIRLKNSVRLGKGLDV